VRPPGAPARVQRRPMPRAGSIPITALRPSRLSRAICHPGTLTTEGKRRNLPSGALWQR
jgi:hypothetical protein